MSRFDTGRSRRVMDQKERVKVPVKEPRQARELNGRRNLCEKGLSGQLVGVSKAFRFANYGLCWAGGRIGMDGERAAMMQGRVAGQGITRL